MKSIRYLISFLLFFLYACIDPVEPQFEFKEGIVFVEGFASTTSGASYVVIQKSVTEFGVNKTVFESGASVSFINSDSGAIVQLSEQVGVYVPDNDFKAFVGEQWELSIVLEDGTRYKSTSEKILQPVPVTNLQATYNPELQFNDGKGIFEPGHSVAVTFEDPLDDENFYYWSFRSFENLTVCETCFDSILRDGECTPTNISTPDYFNYLCDTDCWRIRFPESITIFDDKFSNGKTTTDLIVANIPLYTKENMVVEIQQFSLTPAAYEYYKVLKDIVDNNSGFNAPPPAALIGNMFNPDDDNDFIFGRFTAAANSIETIYINRSEIDEEAIDPINSVSLEPTLLSPYPPPATIFTTCDESRFRTAIAPEGWIE